MKIKSLLIFNNNIYVLICYNQYIVNLYDTMYFKSDRQGSVNMYFVSFIDLYI